MTYTTTWDETRVLDYFWAGVRQDVDRLALLQQLANVRLERPSDWDMHAIRQDMAGLKANNVWGNEGARMTISHDGSCWCCLSKDKRLYWHHVIQVQHGGSSTPWNLVPICHACHGRVHPWLPAPTSLENRGFVSVADMARHADVMLSRAGADVFRDSEAAE
jgi:5-methylcytosine-specific restriction endonuclease McrA